jgi:hypothetical protein
MCFSLELIKQLLILAVVIVAIIAILQLLVPFIFRKLGITPGEGWAVIVGAFRIFFWALIAIFVIIICFELIACLLQFTGGIPFLDHR